jgi:nucleoside-diphosphate-sugar epimerase
MLGRHIAAALALEGIVVAPVGRDRWDLRRYGSIEELDLVFGETDAVVHCGALTPQPGHGLDRGELCDVNIRACAALGTWAAARNVPLVYIGSAGIYIPQGNASHEDAQLAASPEGGVYGLTKLLGELVLAGLIAEGLQLCVLRATSIYGAGMHPKKLVSNMLDTARRGKAIVLRSPVKDCINFVHAADVARATLMALRRGSRGSYNIAGPALVNMRELAEACVAAAGSGWVEESVVPGGRPESRKFDVSGRKAEAQFGFHPKILLSDGLLMMQEDLYVR